MFDSIKGWLWLHGKMLIGIFISTLLLKSGGIIGKIFGTLGLAFITYKYVMPEVKGYLMGYVSALGADVYNLIIYVQADKAMIMILSAGATKLASNLMLGKAGAS
ncbi:DUF2523 family protein [Rhodanobacter sp. KK11]|jgi:hypothetical protein|uniref:DUF2523 family protein n=1 Tax=Rhodanobacter sp. KK11 TaxID=3083255 RepID=UPI0029666EEC|nr:DUF2523 family protein [Rhodanobacter sp. KK11]MDW2981742.1 DUF2523 family protein [Rhodanobacter sp. KK11]